MAKMVSPVILIIDMQNDFNDPSTRLFCKRANQIIPNINRLTRSARGRQVPVIWVVQEHRRQLVDYGREADISPLHCVEGTPGAAIIAELEREPGDFTVIKRSYSAFYATDLQLLLRCLGCNLVILTGIATDGCVQATGLDAQARDYFVRVVTDATAGTGDDAHRAALVALGRMQPGVILSTEDALDLLSTKNLSE
jgi:nicotinamidase-related amidase